MSNVTFIFYKEEPGWLLLRWKRNISTDKKLQCKSFFIFFFKIRQTSCRTNIKWHTAAKITKKGGSIRNLQRRCRWTAQSSRKCRLCLFVIAPLNTKQHPRRQPVRSQASELPSQWRVKTQWPAFHTALGDKRGGVLYVQPMDKCQRLQQPSLHAVFVLIKYIKIRRLRIKGTIYVLHI